jgi:hypothetical protein
MCKNNAPGATKTRRYTSVQDNTVTLVQKDFNSWGSSSKDYAGMIDQKSSFLQSHYKIYNINLAKELEQGMFGFHTDIKKTAKALTCCSHLCKIAYYPKEDNFHRKSAFIDRTSQKCRNKLCARCNSIKSGKYKRRFLKAYVDDETKHLFEGKYFYFITFGLRHDLKGNRSIVFLDQLKEYVKKMRRSELWKGFFPYHSTTNQSSPKYVPDNKKSGYAQSYELTITKNGFNIHSHVLMCAPPLRGSVVRIEQQFRDKWLEITGDSTNVRLDLVKVDKETVEQIKQGELPKKFGKYISECFKYTVKSGTTRQLKQTFTGIDENGKEYTKSRIDLLSEWIIETKGKKMLTSNGFFKGMQLFKANKSKWDDDKAELEVLPHDPNARYFVGRTADLKFNYSAKFNYDIQYRRYILDRIHVTGIPISFKEITLCGDKFDKYLGMTIDETYEKDLNKWIDQSIKENIAANIPLTQDWINKVTPTVLGANRIKEKMFIQESLFEDI